LKRATLKLHTQAQHFLDLAAALMSSTDMDNYEVVGYDGTRTWSHMVKGTKDFCIGWATGIKAMKANWPCSVCKSDEKTLMRAAANEHQPIWRLKDDTRRC
jgi:hypothetical protein